MSGLRGNPASLKHLAANLRTLPKVVAQDIATRAAPPITSEATNAYTSGQTVYGDARPAGVDGRALSLKRTGDTLSTVRFVAVGTIVRCVLGTPYAKYLIGKYRILPNGALPAAWSELLGQISREGIARRVAA
jgi:hypothetical protein